MNALLKNEQGGSLVLFTVTLNVTHVKVVVQKRAACIIKLSLVANLLAMYFSSYTINCIINITFLLCFIKIVQHLSTENNTILPLQGCLLCPPLASRFQQKKSFYFSWPIGWNKCRILQKFNTYPLSCLENSWSAILWRNRGWIFDESTRICFFLV